MKRKVAVITGTLVLAASLLAASPALAAEPAPRAPGAPADAPAYDASVPAPGPGDLTWEQFNAQVTYSGTSFIASTPASSAKAGVGTNAVVPITGGNGQICRINTGDVYKRSSGSIYPYGAVGGHPATVCTVPMVRINQSTSIYKTVWWGLQQVAGPFDSWNVGQGSLQQTSPIRKCDDLRDTTFRMIVRSTGTFPTGTTGTATAYEEANLPCGTNP